MDDFYGPIVYVLAVSQNGAWSVDSVWKTRESACKRITEQSLRLSDCEIYEVAVDGVVTAVDVCIPALLQPASELKPCPFCGAAPRIESFDPGVPEYPDDPYSDIVPSGVLRYLIECQCCGSMFRSDTRRETVVDKWNNRLLDA